jgi:hypothetical protein
MVTLTMGDLYRDQPAVLTSVGMSIPDDSQWETFRGNGEQYNEYIGKIYYGRETKSRQLPTKVDINVGMNLMEKTRFDTDENGSLVDMSRSSTNADHYNITATDA